MRGIDRLWEESNVMNTGGETERKAAEHTEGFLQDPFETDGDFEVFGMKKNVLVLVLQQYEKLEKLLAELNRAGIKGATVVHSAGMVQALSHETDAILGSLRAVLNPERESNRTIFILLRENQLPAAKKVIHDVIGSLDRPETGILFVLPVLESEGLEE